MYDVVLLEIANNFLKNDIDDDSNKVKKRTNKKIIPMFQTLKNYEEKTFIFSNCCEPLPGDSVFGIEGIPNEIEVHNYQCMKYKKLLYTHPSDIIMLD
jgi:(p)ppGpp synthase/HD superfamily hydrolase